jgi:bifunctional UDP-N-acetylglucosamine pyrophosphorylase/glucosamine-1-phosphate N-acetyltransferase
MGYGRIVRQDIAGKQQVVGIIEQKDASAEQLQINEANTGILLANGGDLKRWLSNLSSDNAQGEYYLPDVLSLILERGGKVAIEKTNYITEIQGVNTIQQLRDLDAEFQKI